MEPKHLNPTILAGVFIVECIKVGRVFRFSFEPVIYIS